MNDITGFTFFNSYYECLRDLEVEDRRELLDAIVTYVFEDIEPEFIGFKKTIWTLMLPILNTSKTKSRNAQKKAEEKQKQNKTKTKQKRKENSDLLENKNKNKKENKKRKEIEKEEGDNSCLTTRSIYEFIEENYGRPISPIEYEKVENWLEDFSEEIIEYAIRKSVIYNKKTFSYVNGILRNWKSNGYRTLQEIKDNEIKLFNSERPQIDQEIFEYDWFNDGEEDE